MTLRVEALAELSHIRQRTEVIVGPVLVMAIREREFRISKRPFRSIRVRDNTSALNLNSYVSSSQIYTRLDILEVEMVIEAVGEWNPEYPSIELRDFAIRNDVAISHFFNENLQQRLSEKLENIMTSFQKSSCYNLTKKVFSNSEHMTRFLTSPASRSYHHAYPGGLALHTFEVVEYCDRFSDLNAEVNRDWLITCALLHDIGKIFVYDKIGEMTKEGKLKGHVILGYELLTRLMDEIEAFPKKLRQELEHSIVSHMGEVGKFGSYATPSTPIALLVHKMDELSAELARL